MEYQDNELIEREAMDERFSFRHICVSYATGRETQYFPGHFDGSMTKGPAYTTKKSGLKLFADSLLLLETTKNTQISVI